MELKDSLLKLKHAIFNGEELDFSELEGVSQDRFAEYYKELINLKEDEEKPVLTTVGKKKWSESEKAIVGMYLDDGNGTNTQMFKDLADILFDRDKGSISFQYYHNIREKDEIEEIELISSKEEPIVEENDNDGNDMLDIVVGLVENIEKADMDAVSLFKQLLTFSQKAVENNSDQENVEKLEGELEFYKQELESEKNKNNELQQEVAQIISEFHKVKQEVEYFNNLNGKQRLTNISSFSSKLKYLVDKFGGVVAVSSNDEKAS